MLHLIPGFFPSVWHTILDDGEHLDIPTVMDWALLTSAFTAEYLELEGYFDLKSHPVRDYDDLLKKSEL